jgi:hypothetical protein
MIGHQKLSWANESPSFNHLKDWLNTLKLAENACKVLVFNDSYMIRG